MANAGFVLIGLEYKQLGYVILSALFPPGLEAFVWLLYFSNGTVENPRVM